MFLKISQAIWDALYKMCTWRVTIFELITTIPIAQKGDWSATEYYSHLVRLFEKLNLYQPLTSDIETQRKQRELMLANFYWVSICDAANEALFQHQIKGSITLISFL